MNKQTLRRIGWVGVSLGLTSVLVGCNDVAADSSAVGDSTQSSSNLDTQNGLVAVNGFTGVNGLTGSNGLTAGNGLNLSNGLVAGNGLTSVNGFASINGLVGVNGFQGTNGFTTVNGFAANNGFASINGLNLSNGLTSQNGLGEAAGMMTSDPGRMVVKYLAKCALASNDTLVKKDQNGANYTFPGGLGLAPQWKTGGCGSDCAEAISACMMAHINTSGVHIPLWMVGPETSVGWGQSPWFPTREGTFFGQMMVTNAQNNVDAYYCDGPGSDKNVVPGRLGFTQGTVPYANAFPATAGMDGLCDTSHSTGSCAKHALSTGETTTDGPDSCTLNGHQWNFPLTVWRGETFQAEAAEGGMWYDTVGGRPCQSGDHACTWNPGIFGFNASNCTPGSNCSIIADSKNGMGHRVGNIGPSKGVKFANVNVACAGTANLVVYTTNGRPKGDNSLHLNFIVNGGSPQNITFQGQGDWSNPGGTTISLTGFNQGSNNTIYAVGDPYNSAPDLDWIEIVNSGTTCQAAAVGSCTESVWVESASANSGAASTGDDGSNSTRYSTGRAMHVGDYYQVDFTGPIYLTSIKLDNTSDGSSGDYAAKYDLYSSMDGSTWTKFVTGASGAANSTTISFSKTQMRYIRVQINTANSNSGLYWSIGEFNGGGCTLN